MTHNLTAEIEQDGKFIQAQIEKARQYEAKAEDKAGTELRKAADHWASVYARIAEVRKKCKDAGWSFAEFKAEYCPDLGRTKLYKVLAIADGRTTVEAEKSKEAERKSKTRAKASGTTDVPDSMSDDVTANGHDVDAPKLSPTAAQEQAPIMPPVTPEQPSKQVTEKYVNGRLTDISSLGPAQIAALVAAAPEMIAEATVESKPLEQNNVVVAIEQIVEPAAARTLEGWQSELSDQMDEACCELSQEQKIELLEFLGATIERLGLSGDRLVTPSQQFKNGCDTWLPAMSDDERRKARIHISEWKPRAKRKVAEAA